MAGIKEVCKGEGLVKHKGEVLERQEEAQKAQEKAHAKTRMKTSKIRVQSKPDLDEEVLVAVQGAVILAGQASRARYEEHQGYASSVSSK